MNFRAYLYFCIVLFVLTCFLAQIFCPVLQVKEVMMQTFPDTKQGPPLT